MYTQTPRRGRSSSSRDGQKRSFSGPARKGGFGSGPRRATSSRPSSAPARTGASRGSSFSSSRGENRGGGRSFSSQSGGPRGGNRGRGGRGGGKKLPTFNPSQFINKNPVDILETLYVPKHTFDTFGLSDILVREIIGMGITIPTPIQDQIIPEILAGKDVIGLAETGTGKTAAFLVPLIEKTLKDPKRETLILAPTRELAIQIEDEFRKLSRGMKLFSVTCVGGMNIHPQIKRLRMKNHFVIGTPGRVIDLIDRGIFKPQFLTTVVLDEADRMLDMGFINDMRSILSKTPTNRETLLFSATMSDGTKGIVKDFLKNPVMVSVKKKDVTNSIEQDVVAHGHHNKFEKLVELLKQADFKRVIIFGAMKHSVQKLADELSRSGLKAESIHGNKSHGQRQQALKKIKNGQAEILVATDVAARGIHVDNVTHVINYDLPNTFEDYIHRIGRTGRGDKKGKALTFVASH